MLKNNGACDLEYAQRLKELGMPQESIWWWRLKNSLAGAPPCWFVEREDFSYGGKVCSAPTAGELGELLPTYIEYKNEQCWLYIKKSVASNYWIVAYCNSAYVALYFETKITLVNTLAKMLIYLYENNLMPKGGKDGNKRKLSVVQ